MISNLKGVDASPRTAVTSLEDYNDMLGIIKKSRKVKWEKEKVDATWIEGPLFTCNSRNPSGNGWWKNSSDQRDNNFILSNKWLNKFSPSVVLFLINFGFQWNASMLSLLVPVIFNNNYHLTITLKPFGSIRKLLSLRLE